MTDFEIKLFNFFFEPLLQEQRNETDQQRISELQQQLEAASNEQQSSKKHSQEVHRLRAELEEARTKHAQGKFHYYYGLDILSRKELV